jgi:hypothetical protein
MWLYCDETQVGPQVDLIQSIGEFAADGAVTFGRNDNCWEIPFVQETVVGWKRSRQLSGSRILVRVSNVPGARLIS